MPNTLVSLRLSDNLLKEVDVISKEEGFSNIQEFIRDSIRLNIQKKKLEQSLLALDKLSGSAKNPKFKTKKQVEEYIKKLYP
jgi:metal-responsive CopG/Arc/MetJ family transcriptional regulator